MRVLYLAYRFPHPPDKGERIRAFHQIDSLSRRASLHLVCPAGGTAPQADELARRCASLTTVRSGALAAHGRQLGAWLRGAPAACGAFDAPALRGAVREVVRRERIEVVLASSLFVAGAVRDLPDVRTVLDLIDIYSAVVREQAEHRRGLWRALARIEARRLRAYETALAREFDAVLVASQAEARLLRAQLTGKEIHVVGNGVDLKRFAPDPEARRRHPPDFVFTGSMDYPPNIDAVLHFCAAILPRLRSRLPGATLTVVGRHPPLSIRRLAREASVRVTGAVEDVRPYLAAATAAVAPMRLGGGVQNKVLEAMAMGVTVVGTTRALAGLPRPDERAARRADDPETFAAELAALAEDADWRHHCEKAARRYVERHHRWADRGEELLAILRRV